MSCVVDGRSYLMWQHFSAHDCHITVMPTGYGVPCWRRDDTSVSQPYCGLHLGYGAGSGVTGPNMRIKVTMLGPYYEHYMTIVG